MHAKALRQRASPTSRASEPSMYNWPFAGGSSRVIPASRVDLPAPDRPIKTTCSPGHAPSGRRVRSRLVAKHAELAALRPVRGWCGFGFRGAQCCCRRFMRPRALQDVRSPPAAMTGGELVGQIGNGCEALNRCELCVGTGRIIDKILGETGEGEGVGECQARGTKRRLLSRCDGEQTDCQKHPRAQ
eukprot:scaffold49701_cov33-Tisochrysis_lutea.AAC.3